MNKPRLAIVRLLLSAAAALLSVDSVYAHGEHEHADSMLHTAHPPATNGTSSSTVTFEEPSYFVFPTHKGLLYGHIFNMSIGWIFVMPVSVMLAIAGSRYHFPAQILFLTTNIIGIAFAMLYNYSTPDLYPGNAHHKFGWLLVSMLVVQAITGVIAAAVKSTLPNDCKTKEERLGFMPIPTNSPVEQTHRHEPYRESRDSGHGSEINSMSLDEGERLHAREDGFARIEFSRWETAPTAVVDEEKEPAAKCIFGGNWIEQVSARWALPSEFGESLVRLCEAFYMAVERALVFLGFVQISLGIVTASGIFMGDHVFNGLAHFVKGGIFFLYGILTLGRWLGAFSEFGWAWNVKPPAEFGGSKWRLRTPSAEFVECFSIFLYGSTNVFMEHLAGWGGAWTHTDLEHVSIAFMLFGGGLCGMLVESRMIRDLLNRTVSTSSVASSTPMMTSPHGANVILAHNHRDQWREPETYRFSYNPLPGMVIFILGIMMSKHHQTSALSTTIHTQWGTLLAASAVFRLFTYALTYMRPPNSYLPSRPPTELLASFCLMAGGLVFMASNKDTVAYLEKSNLDPMFILTVTIGITALLMSWITAVMALKGWALRREQARGGSIMLDMNAVNVRDGIDTMH